MSDARLIASSGACMLVLGAVGLFGPPGASLALLALPLPALVAGGIGGTSHATAATIGAAGVMGGVVGGSVGCGFIALVGMPAIVAVLLLRRAWRLEAVVAAAMLATVAGGLAMAIWHEPNPSVWRSGLEQAWQSSFDTSLQIYRDFGMSTQALADLEAARNEIAERVATVLPALIVLAAAAVWLANIGLSRRWAWWPQMLDLSRWRTADWLIWVLIASGFSLFLAPRAIGWIATNLFIVALACYFAQGLAIVSYFLQRVGLPRPLRAAAFAVIVLQNLATAVVVALGVFDLWGDFRNLTARPADATAGRDADG
ncbi:DUF2232 domain-containing protein [bacterium]|nr:DUF2232 domain-containing protein [bacterium]